MQRSRAPKRPYEHIPDLQLRLIGLTGYINGRRLTEAESIQIRIESLTRKIPKYRATIAAAGPDADPDWLAGMHRSMNGCIAALARLRRAPR